MYMDIHVYLYNGERDADPKQRQLEIGNQNETGRFNDHVGLN
jgi:hypothetical protein